MKNYNRFLLLLVCISCQQLASQTIEGTWKTIDDRNGTAKAILEIYKENGLLQGKILKIVEKGKENFICTKCCLLYTSPSPRDRQKSRMPSSA